MVCYIFVIIFNPEYLGSQMNITFEIQSIVQNSKSLNKTELQLTLLLCSCTIFKCCCLAMHFIVNNKGIL